MSKGKQLNRFDRYTNAKFSYIRNVITIILAFSVLNFSWRRARNEYVRKQFYFATTIVTFCVVITSLLLSDISLQSRSGWQVLSTYFSVFAWIWGLVNVGLNKRLPLIMHKRITNFFGWIKLNNKIEILYTNSILITICSRYNNSSGHRVANFRL